MRLEKGKLKQWFSLMCRYNIRMTGRHIYIPLLRLHAHIKEQKLSRLVANTLDLDLSRSSSVGDVCAITLAQLNIADLDLCTTSLGLLLSTHDEMHKDISLALSHDIVSNALARTQDTGIHAQIRMQRNRLILCILAAVSLLILHDPHEFVFLHLIRKLSRHVTRF
jgi:hypothetical protein